MSGPRGGALSLAGALAAAGAGLSIVVVVSRSYPQAVAGTFFAAVSLFVILHAMCGLGTDVGLVRWLPRHLAFGRGEAARRTVTHAVVPVASAAAIVAGVLFITAPWLADLTGTGNPEMLRVLCAFLPFAAVQEVLLAATRGYGTVLPTVLIEKIGRQATQVAGVGVAALTSAGPVVLALVWALPYLAGVTAAAFAWGRLKSSAGGGEGSSGLGGEFWRYTAPRALAQVSQTALQRADIVLLAALSSARDAAVYAAATRFVVVGQLGAQAVQQVMQPAVSRQLALSDGRAARRTFAVCTTWTVLLTWPVYLGVVVAAPVYLAAFGPGYPVAGHTATVLLGLTMLLATACGPVDVMLLMAGRSGISLGNNALALAVNLGLNLVLIPQHGVTGAAIAWTAALVVRNLLPLVQVRRLLGMGPGGAGLGHACAAAVVCLGAVPLLAPGPPQPWLFAGALVYGSLLWRRRERFGGLLA